MAVTAASFRAAFPEFGNAVTYPDTQFAFWLAQAAIQVNPFRYGLSADLVTMLFVAHNLVLAARAAAGGATASTGVQSSKSVGGASVSYDTTLTATDGAGIYNATSYGQRLYQLMRSFTSGPVYVPGPSPRLGGYVYGYGRR